MLQVPCSNSDTTNLFLMKPFRPNHICQSLQFHVPRLGCLISLLEESRPTPVQQISFTQVQLIISSFICPRWRSKSTVHSITFRFRLICSCGPTDEDLFFRADRDLLLFIVSIIPYRVCPFAPNRLLLGYHSYSLWRPLSLFPSGIPTVCLRSISSELSPENDAWLF